MQLHEVPTPSYVIDEGKLIDNLKILERVQKEAGCKILLAQKAFSMYSEYPLIGKYLAGTTASGLYEARLGKEEMGKENHVFAPAYHENEIDELAGICDHIIFNSFSQIKKFALRCRSVKTCNTVGRNDEYNSLPSLGLRINPECSTQGDHAIYDPCAPGSRLGVTLSNFEKALGEDSHALDLIDGLHFHTLCEQNSDDLETTVAAVEEKFGKYLHQMKWLNMGGGHHITREDYDIERLISIIRHLKETYGVEIYLEPGEAIALNAGYLVTEIMDVVDNGIKTLILDASAACHMPDVLEMPYRPPLMDSGEAGEKKYTYRLSSCTCLAGDIIGDYSFDEEKGPKDRLYFMDMAIYSMVKNNTFNGIGLPSIYVMRENGDCELVRQFGYEDFKMRL
ncbi:MAG: carboxynorspermidine decarboxylase [Agathobacter sp.]